MATEHDARSVWDKQLATVTELCHDPDWPLGRTATYDAIQRGEIPHTRLGGKFVVLVPALRQRLGMVGPVGSAA